MLISIARPAWVPVALNVYLEFVIELHFLECVSFEFSLKVNNDFTWISLPPHVDSNEID